MRDETVAIDYSSRSFGTQFQDLGDVVVVNFEFQRSRKLNIDEKAHVGWDPIVKVRNGCGEFGLRFGG